MLMDRSLDETARARGEQVVAAAKASVLAGQQELMDMLTGHAVKEEISYKQGAPTGGGGRPPRTVDALEEAARGEKALNVIMGKSDSQGREVQGEKLGDVNAAMETLEAADAISRDIKGLGAESSDIDDPLSGPIDAAARLIGTGGSGRRTRQSLESNTQRLARGIQQSLGKSDNDAKLADQMAIGDGSGVSRLRQAETARRAALGRIQTAVAGMTPQQRQTFLRGLTAERRTQVNEALSATAQPVRAASETAVE
jgi:hypothetical protein